MLERNSVRQSLLSNQPKQKCNNCVRTTIFIIFIAGVVFMWYANYLDEGEGGVGVQTAVGGGWLNWAVKTWVKSDLPEDFAKQIWSAPNYGWPKFPNGDACTVNRCHIIPESWIAWIWNGLKEDKRLPFATLIDGESPRNPIDNKEIGYLVWGGMNVRYGWKSQNTKIGAQFDPVFEDAGDGKFKFNHATRNLLKFISDEANWKPNIVKDNWLHDQLQHMIPKVVQNKIQSSGECPGYVPSDGKTAQQACKKDSLEVELIQIVKADRELLTKLWNMDVSETAKVKELLDWTKYNMQDSKEFWKEQEKNGLVVKNGFLEFEDKENVPPGIQRSQSSPAILKKHEMMNAHP